MNEENFDLNKIWNGVLEAIKLDVSGAVFKMFVEPTALVTLTEAGGRKIATVACFAGHIKDTIEKRYFGQLTKELSRVLNQPCEIVLVVKAREVSSYIELGPLFETKKIESDSGAIKRANLRDDYTFETYAVGGSNQMAFAAAQAVARRPGEAYNPLFIYGGVGVGKTHLMQAIGREIIINNKQTTALFCSGEEFTNDLVEAIRYKTTEKVRAKYRKVKILMIDDVQFIAGKPGIQEEFFHTFNAITRDGGQVIMTSDRPPGEIAKLEERLRSRFGAGLIVDVGQPDFELRTAILLIKSKQRGIELDMKVAQTIAANIEGVRELQGFLTRILTEAEVKGVKISNDWVGGLLNANNNNNTLAKIVTPNDLFNLVSNYYGVGVSQLKGERRTKTLAWARQVLMYLLHIELKLPLEEVGRLVGGRDHSTVIHARDKVLAELSANSSFANEIMGVKKKLMMGTTSA